LGGGDRCELAVLAVKLDFRADIDVRQAVAIGQAEGVVAQICATRFRRPPVMVSGPVSMSVTFQGSDCELKPCVRRSQIDLKVGSMTVVVKEKFLDYVPL